MSGGHVGSTFRYRRAGAAPLEPMAAIEGDADRLLQAREGSACLKENIELLFERFARRHGLTKDVARRLQLEGYRA